MMVGLLGEHGHLGHESKCRRKIGAANFSLQHVVFVSPMFWNVHYLFLKGIFFNGLVAILNFYSALYQEPQGVYRHSVY